MFSKTQSLSILAALTGWFDSLLLKLSAVPPGVTSHSRQGGRGKQLLAVSVSSIKNTNAFSGLNPCSFMPEWLKVELTATHREAQKLGNGIIMFNLD